MASFYRKPYLDSGVFIAWVKNEVIRTKDDQGNEVVVERGKIGEHVLTLAENKVYPIVISSLTLAEVHKKKGQAKLQSDENQNILDYFEHDFINLVVVDRTIGEEANRLCRLHEDKKLSPCDAIHLACAKAAGCDVLLSWDEVLNSIEDPAIKTERPRIQELGQRSGGQGKGSDQGSLFVEQPTARVDVTDDSSTITENAENTKDND